MKLINIIKNEKMKLIIESNYFGKINELKIISKFRDKVNLIIKI